MELILDNKDSIFYVLDYILNTIRNLIHKHLLGFEIIDHLITIHNEAPDDSRTQVVVLPILDLSVQIKDALLQQHVIYVFHATQALVVVTDHSLQLCDIRLITLLLDSSINDGLLLRRVIKLFQLFDLFDQDL